MRRYLAGILTLLLLSQSSGIALAGTTGFSPGHISLAALLQPLQLAVTSSRLYADLTGSGDRYAALHAPPPVIRRPQTTLDAAGLMRSREALRPRVRHGVRQLVVMPDLSALDVHHRRLDPLAMRRSPGRPSSEPHGNVPIGNAIVLKPLQVLSAPAAPRQSHSLTPGRGGKIRPMTSGSGGTGIEHWWDYQERGIAGIGKAMVNVGTGNLLVTAMDFDIHEQGIDLAFQRAYNSQSLHDVNGDDGGDPSIFGNLWTNNLDASIVYDPVAVTITVYDIDGTACTYTSIANGTWQPCTGEYATLAPTDGTDCTYAWTKTNGTVYWFHADTSGGGCSIPQSKKGQLQKILARNQTNYITFTYSYYGSSKTSEDISQIEVQHSDNDTLYMNFGIIPGTSINELSSITLPDNATLQYLYDTSGNLVEVDKPGNNPAQTIPNAHSTLPQGDAPETYAYASGTSAMQEACGPRCTVAMWNHPNNPTDGGALLFGLNSSMQLASWQFQGVLNFTPPSPDPTSTVLQSGASTSFTTWYTANFVYGAGSACSNTSAGTTTMCDTDGHGANWTLNGNNSVTYTSEYTGTAEAQWITTKQDWDSNNDLIDTIDANGNETKYGYDSAGSGNMVEMQLPQMSDITNGPLAPLSYYSYDSNHNITAYCDPVYNQNNGKSWISSPGNSPCPGGNNTTNLTSSTTNSEPFGCLTNITKPSGYSTDITYAGSGTCGVGLPAKVKAHSSISQPPDGSSRQPVEDFTYDSNGNLTGYDRGQGTSGNLQQSWTLSYNQENINYEQKENEPTIPSAVITSFSCHYPDGSLFYSETPSQHAADGNPSCPAVSTLLSGPATAPANATAYLYDTDGDEVQIIDHKGGATSVKGTTTTKFYDGLDRLVETIMPQDTRTLPNGTQTYDCYPFAWMTRYIYDLSMQGGSANLAIGGVSNVVAYGGLYKTQEYLPNATTMQSCTVSNPRWTEVRGSDFDAFGRVVNKYELDFGNAPEVINVYDGTNELGLLSESENTVQSGSHQTTNYTYDAVNHVKEMDFGGPAPTEDNRTYTYDADGRGATITTATLGQMAYAYDVDGNKTSQSDPASETNASTVSYTNYPDGLREYLSISGGINKQKIFSYAYRQDGLLDYQSVNWGSAQGAFSWTYTSGGRELTEADPLTAAQVTTYYYPPNNGTTINGQTTYGAKTYGYDQFGRVSSLLYPEGYQGDTMQYDVDDELVGMSASNEATNGQDTNDSLVYNYILNARGELLSDRGCVSNCTGTDWAQSANGTLVDPAGQMVGSNAALSWNTLSGMVMSNGYQVNRPLVGGTNQYQYDSSGRQYLDTLTPPSGYNNGPFTYTRSYDAENHLVAAPTGDSCNPNNNLSCYAGATLSWGPDGQLRGIVQTQAPSGWPTPQNTDLHWDGNTLLFTTVKPNGNSSQTALYVGKMAVTWNAGGFLVADRNQNGIAEAYHNGSAYGAWNNFSYHIVGAGRLGVSAGVGVNWGSCYVAPSNTNGVCQLGTPSAGGTPAAPNGLQVDFSRSDGYSFGSYAVQGVRAYDSTSQQWLTPDAYVGDVHNPISQKPFIWNDNNPVEWSDPTGFDPVVVPRDMQHIWGFAKAASSEFRKLATSIANIKGAKVEISDTRVSHSVCNCYGQTSQEVQHGHVVGTIEIHLTKEALQSGSSFAGTTGHEMTHGLDYSRSAAAADNAKSALCKCEGGNQLEARAYGNENTVNEQVQQYLKNHTNPPGPDANKQATPP